MRRSTLMFLTAAACLIWAGYAGAVPAGTSIHDLLPRAQQGEAKAQNDLGVLLTEGSAAQRDDAQAVEWFRKAAEQGLVEAQYNLSVMYANGQGVRQDDTETVRWSKMAADRGHPGAQYQLGLLYAVGAGVSQNYIRAYKWFSIAARKLQGMDREIAVEDRNLIAAKMTTAQVSAAEKIAREWKPVGEDPILAANDT